MDKNTRWSSTLQHRSNVNVLLGQTSMHTFSIALIPMQLVLISTLGRLDINACNGEQLMHRLVSLRNSHLGREPHRLYHCNVEERMQRRRWQDVVSCIVRPHLGQKRACIAAAAGIQPLTSKDILSKIHKSRHINIIPDLRCAALVIQAGVQNVSRSLTYSGICFELTCVTPLLLGGMCLVPKEFCCRGPTLRKNNMLSSIMQNNSK